MALATQPTEFLSGLEERIDCEWRLTDAKGDTKWPKIDQNGTPRIKEIFQEYF